MSAAKGLGAMISMMTSASVENAKERLALAAERLPELRAAASEAAGVDAEMRASFAEEREAAEALLRTAVEAARPALPLICTPEKFFSDEPRRVALIGSIDSKDPPRRRQLFLSERGVLLEATYEFESNHWPLVGLDTVSLGWVVRHGCYVIEKVVATLLRLCAEAADGNGKRRAATARRRAERLRAVATLIGAAGGAK